MKPTLNNEPGNPDLHGYPEQNKTTNETNEEIEQWLDSQGWFAEWVNELELKNKEIDR